MSPYVQKAARAALPTKIYISLSGVYIVGVKGDDIGGFDGEECFALTHAEATRAYLDLVRQIEETRL